MSDAPTIRSHLQRGLSFAEPGPIPPEMALALMAGCIADALAMLDNAEADMFDHETGIIRIVPDYQPDRDQPHHAPGWTHDD